MIALLLRTAAASLRFRRALVLENLALRHQLLVLQQSAKRPRLSKADRGLWVLLFRIFAKWRDSLVIVKPATVVGRHRNGFGLYWKWKSGKPGRPKVDAEVRTLIRRMSRENPLWGAPRIHGELLKLDIDLSEPTIAKYMVHCGRPSPRSPWQNPYVERVIGSIRWECLDHVVISNENHLRKVLRGCIDYYHESRTHLGLNKDCPASRSVEPPGIGKVVAIPQVGWLHHRYTRIAA